MDLNTVLLPIKINAQIVLQAGTKGSNVSEVRLVTAVTWPFPANAVLLSSWAGICICIFVSSMTLDMAFVPWFFNFLSTLAFKTCYGKYWFVHVAWTAWSETVTHLHWTWAKSPPKKETKILKSIICLSAWIIFKDCSVVNILFLGKKNPWKNHTVYANHFIWWKKIMKKIMT